MSDGRRRRFRKFKPDEKQTTRPITLAKRQDEDRPFTGAGSSYSSSTHRYAAAAADAEVQPKILLKTKAAERDDDDELVQAPLRTMIVTRSEATISPAALSAASPNTTREQQAAATETASALSSHQLAEPTPQMRRAATVLTSTGFINAGARKLLVKPNCDFLVVGVIGTQGVGKSTVMNLLAAAEWCPDYDYRKHVFLEGDGIFLTKLKPHKCSARSRTESTHMYISSDRLIMLDSPPVLCNSYKKDMTTNELDDLRIVVAFLSVCHLLIVVQDDYFNLSLMRLLQFAELMKPAQENTPFLGDYLPNVLFVRNRAKRLDFVPGAKERMDAMLRAFFRDSQLRVYMGQTGACERHKKGRGLPETERVINSFLLPEVTDTMEIYHPPLHKLIEDFRLLVFTTPRNEMYSGASEFTEAIWFEMLAKVALDTQHYFFFNTYEEIHRRHLEVGVSTSGNSNNNGHHSNNSNNNNNSAAGSSNNNSKDTDRYENWRE